MGRRPLNRKELRANYDAAERRAQDEEADDVEDEEEDDEEDEEEGDGDADADADAEEGDDDDDDLGDDEDDEDGVKRKKKKKKAKPKPKAKAKPKTTKTRTRTAKVTRMRVVWAVFNNSNQQVASYDYPKKQDAYDHAAKLTADKKNTHFVQPVKIPMEEKKDS